MSSAGSTKNKPKKSSNLRILWIPGRKKHNRKGTYNSTKNGLPQTYGMQPRKNESWTLGGTMNHTKIINANFFFRDLHENNLDVATIVTTAATGSALATMVTANGPTAEQQQQLDQLEPCPSTSTGKGQQSPQPQIVVGTIELNNLNGDIASNKQEKEIGTSNQFETLTLIDEDDEEKDRNCSNAHSSSSLLSSNNDNRSTEENNLHNANTLSIGEQHRNRNRRRSSQKDRRSAEDIDSIDQADSAVDVTHEEEPHVFDDEEEEEEEEDVEESEAKKQQKQQQNGPNNHHVTAAAVRRRKNRRSRQKRTPVLERQDVIDGEEDRKEPYDKAVTCLYWSLACWDCNIS
ncbi:uncharacterized protein DDB_G0283697 [Anopheles maculipalpis]|uniref:uncharacterized protein DDB_G0283697 n=1 Tax=Anopheles maculipalpis TaxID=1496333 RepID=UPI0021595610|nr:uncharacterized protein DDB_G0283697 [Anopheles maculipalpis]